MCCSRNGESLSLTNTEISDQIIIVNGSERQEIQIKSGIAHELPESQRKQSRGNFMAQQTDENWMRN